MPAGGSSAGALPKSPPTTLGSVRLRPDRRGDGDTPFPEFARREIVCADEDAAKAEAARQEAADDPAIAEWIYLHSDKTGQWVARRVPRDPASYQKPTSLRSAFLGGIIENL